MIWAKDYLLILHCVGKIPTYAAIMHFWVFSFRTLKQACLSQFKNIKIEAIGRKMTIYGAKALNGTLGTGYQVGLALTDLRCFRTLRLKIRDPDIMYWNWNFNLKVIQCLWIMLEQKIHLWHFRNIFVLEAMFQIFISDSWNVVGNFHQ